MKRLAMIATIVAALALPAAGQHGVSRGGFSGHAVSAPHGSFGGGPIGAGHISGSRFGGGFAAHGPIGIRPSAPGPRGFAPPSGPVRFAPGYRPGMSRPLYRGNAFADRSRRGGDGDRNHHHRRRYWGGYGYSYPYYYAGPIFTGYVDPWLFSPDDYGYGNGDASYGGYGYGGNVPAPYREYGTQPAAPDEYPDQSTPAQSAAARPAYTPQSAPPAYSSTAAPEDPVTVIFKDGRAPEQIHNYLLTSTTLTVLDAHYRQIPLDDVNIAATVAANRAAGVDFRVPAAR